MGAERPFRFGIQHYPASSRQEWQDNARRAEQIGYDTFLMPDHIGQGGLAYAPALTAAADVTSSLRIGTLVLSNDFRSPALVASEAATLDLLSDGRFELGIGAGWDQSDYQTSGITFDEPRTRVDRFEEGVELIKGLLSGEPVTFHGQHYVIHDLRNDPRPVQRPRPPLLIGASGRRMLAIAAREADIVSVMPPGLGSSEGPDLTATAMSRSIDHLGNRAGDRFDAIELGTLLQRLIITDDPRPAAEDLAERWSMAADDVLESPWALIGSVEEIVDTLQERRDRFGVTYYAIPGWYMEGFAPIVARLAGR